MANRSKGQKTPTVLDGIERDDSSMQDEILAAQALNRPHAVTLEHEYLRACGKLYGTNGSNVEIADDPENWRYTWLRNFLSEVAQGVPECRIEPRGAEWRPSQAYLLEAAVNAQSHRSRMDLFAQRTAIDFGFRSSRAVCGLQERYGRLEPFAKRLPFDEFLWDSTVTDRQDARWHGHRVCRDIDAVLAEAKERPDLGWNVAMLNGIRHGLSNDPKRRRSAGQQVERFELVYWTTWWPNETTGDESKGYHGTVRYVLDPQLGQSTGQRHGELRKPEPFFGPQDGPYAHAAGFTIGELPIGLAPLVASATQGGHVNDVMRAMRDAIANYKQITVMQDDVSAAKVRSSINGQTIVLPRSQDLRTMLATIESGGMQPQHVAALQQTMEGLQRSLGVYSRLGDVATNATATAVNNAEAGYATTMGLYVNTYQGFMRQIFSKWAYWFDMSPQVGIKIGPLPPEIAELVGSEFAETRGSTTNPERHRDMALRIDPQSTRGRNEFTAQADMQAALGMLQFIQALGPYAVAVDVEHLVKQTARMRGAPWIEKLLDADGVRQIGALQLGQQQAPPVKQPQPKPQLGFGAGSGRGSGAQPMGASMTQPQTAAQAPKSFAGPRPGASRSKTTQSRPKPAGASE